MRTLGRCRSVEPAARIESRSLGVKVGVGYHSGSHYSAIQGLEPFLDRSAIELDFVGLPFDRVRLMLQGKIDAANVFGAQSLIAEPPLFLCHPFL